MELVILSTRQLSLLHDLMFDRQWAYFLHRWTAFGQHTKKHKKRNNEHARYSFFGQIKSSQKDAVLAD